MIATGGTVGFSIPWLKLGGTYGAYLSLTFILGRSIYQQFSEYLQYREIIKRSKQLGTLGEILTDLRKQRSTITLPNLDDSRAKILAWLNNEIPDNSNRKKILSAIQALQSISQQNQKNFEARLEIIQQITELALGESFLPMPGIPNAESLSENPIIRKPNLGIRIRN